MTSTIEKILATKGLPSPPGVAMRLLELYDKEDIEITQIGKVISTDPVLTAKLITYCNSPVMARTRLVSSVDQAIVAIGLRAVKMIGVSFSLIQTVPAGDITFNCQQFWNESLATALAARTLTARLKGDKETVFLLGLMLNVGQLALACAFPNEYAELMSEAQERNVLLTNIETERWGVDRYTIGGHLLRKWKFPPGLVDTISTHGQSSNYDQEANRILGASQFLTGLLFGKNVASEQIDFVRQDVASKLGITGTAFDDLFDEFVSYWSEYAAILNFDGSQAKTLSELENRARCGVEELELGLLTENAWLKKENSQLQTNAYADALTGLKNRRAYDKEAVAEWERCKRTQKPFAMLVLDIDHFKLVNDQFGHDAGDAILVCVAQTLLRHTRDYDSVFRIGGEEFVIVLADCDKPLAQAAAERIRLAIESMVVDFRSHQHQVTISIGACCCTDRTRTLEGIFKEADNLLYEVKSTGRNRCCFDSELDTCRPVYLQTEAPLDVAKSLSNKP